MVVHLWVWSLSLVFFYIRDYRRGGEGVKFSPSGFARSMTIGFKRRGVRRGRVGAPLKGVKGDFGPVKDRDGLVTDLLCGIVW